jgi:cytochrome c oxidase subunit 2
MKIDAVRGIDTHIRVTPTRLGDYPVVCAELCGLGHSAMRQTAHVVAPAEFESWLQDRAQQAAGGGEESGGEEEGGAAGGEEEGSAENGKAVFEATGCGSCHALADAGTTGGTGPDLDESLAGQDEAFIEEGIVDPAAEIADGFQDGIMPPNYGTALSPAELDSLVKYLAEVTN